MREMGHFDFPEKSREGRERAIVEHRETLIKHRPNQMEGPSCDISKMSERQHVWGSHLGVADAKHASVKTF